MWPVLTFVALGLLGALHFWWRGKFRRAAEAAARDIEQLQEQQREAWRHHELEQEAVFNSMVEGLLLLDARGRIQLANRAFAKLFDVPGAISRKSVLEVLRWPELVELVESLLPEQPSTSREIRFPGSVELWVLVSAAAILSPDRLRVGTILVFHDLTRLKQLERNREEFVANVSHELRTPLSHIKGYVETLIDGAKDDPQVAPRFLQTIARNAERLKLLIEDLLTISELESGRVTLNLQTIALRNLGDKVVDDFKTRAAARQVTLVNALMDISVLADAARLEQVLSNLLDNAIKYGAAAGCVTLGAELAAAGRVDVFVQDDGQGLPADSLERVFERFYRVDKARSREQGGTGLGLSIVKHIVQSHGGKVWVESEPGRGAKFHFTLRLAGAEEGVPKPMVK